MVAARLLLQIAAETFKLAALMVGDVSKKGRNAAP